MQQRFKVFFHEGPDLGLKTRAQKGTAWIDAAGLNIESTEGTKVQIAAREIRSVEMFRLHGLGRVIRLDHARGRLYISVVRLMIGQFAFINFFRTGKLRNMLSQIVVRP